MRGWKIILYYLSFYKRRVIFLSILGIISALANGIVPLVVGKFFDAILKPSQIFINTEFEMPLWLGLLIIFGTVQVIANITDWVIDVQSRRIGTFLIGAYPSRAVEYLLKFPLSFHKEERAGEVWDKILRAMQAVTGIIERVIIPITPIFLSTIVGIVVAFSIHPILAAVIVSGVLLYVVTLVKIVPPIVIFQRQGHRAWNRAYGTAYDALSNVHAVKRATAEVYETKRVRRKYLDIAVPIWMRVEKIWSNIHFYQRFIIVATQIAVFALAVVFISRGELTIGGLIALNGYAAMVFGPFVRLGFNWEVIQNGLVAIERAEKLLSTETEKYTPKDAIKPESISGEIEFRNASFFYKKDELEVLKDLTFQIHPGETVALVGESGVGKSTLVDLISGYYFPAKGKILIDGHDIKKLDLRFLRNYIAMVPQEIVLFNDTIKFNIKYGQFRATDKEIKEAAKQAYADVFIERFPKKYNQLVGERGIKLSVGQKQRIAIARAILRNPRILILDEPTSALDPETEKYVAESLGKLMKGKTTIIIAHRLSTVRRVNRIFVLEKGTIVEQGSHEELIKIEGGAYQRLYKLHIGLV